MNERGLEEGNEIYDSTLLYERLWDPRFLFIKENRQTL